MARSSEALQASTAARAKTVTINPGKLLKRFRQGSFHNVSFADMRRLMEFFGFELRRVNGSHHIFAHPGIPELLNIQPGEIKPYQIRQFLDLVERYALERKDRR